jgi:hypothetical protein
MTQQWNPLDKHANFILSDNNLTETGGSIWTSMRALESVSSGKWYWELYHAVNSELMFGVGTDQFSLGSYPGASHEGWSMYFFGVNGEQYHLGDNKNLGTRAGSGNVYMLALDMDNSKLWYGCNGSWFNSGDPAAGVNPIHILDKTPLFPAVCGPGTSTARFTEGFSYVPPIGFSGFLSAMKPPACYLGARTNRMNMKGVSIQDNLA